MSTWIIYTRDCITSKNLLTTGIEPATIGSAIPCSTTELLTQL